MKTDLPASENEELVHLIVVEDEEVVIEHHFEDWLAIHHLLGARDHRLRAVLHALCAE